MAKRAVKDRGRKRKYDPKTSRRIPPQVDPNGLEYRALVKVDFTGVTSGFEPIANGAYPAVLTKAEIKDSKSTPGAKYISVEFTLSDEAGDAAGRKMFVNWSLQPKALWRFKQDAVALGIDPDDLAGEVDVDAILTDLKGREAILEVTTESYKANDGSQKERNQVTNIREMTVGGVR